jgi:centromeric protein E
VHAFLQKGIFVAGLREEIVSSPKQVFELLEFGEGMPFIRKLNLKLFFTCFVGH